MIDTRQCRWCKNTYPLNKQYFVVHPNRPSGFTHQCKNCRNEECRERYATKHRAENKRLGITAKRHMGVTITEDDRPQVQQCPKCRQIKPFTEEFFPPDGKKNFGLRLQCKQCKNIQARISGAKYRLKIKLAVFSHYSNGEMRCNCCKESHLEFLSIDHINGGGNKHRKSLNHNNMYTYLQRNNFPEGYQVLCHNCNQSKGFFGYCPHNQDSRLLETSLD